MYVYWKEHETYEAAKKCFDETPGSMVLRTLDAGRRYRTFNVRDVPTNLPASTR